MRIIPDGIMIGDRIAKANIFQTDSKASRAVNSLGLSVGCGMRRFPALRPTVALQFLQAVNTGSSMD